MRTISYLIFEYNILYLCKYTQVTMKYTIYKKIYIIQFQHINIILIPRSEEFDVQKKNCGELCSLAEIGWADS